MPTVKSAIRSVALLGALALVLAAASASAFNPADDVNQRYEVRLPAFRGDHAKDFGGLAASQRAEATLAARYGGTWTVHAWSAQTETPRWVYGSAPRLAPAITSAAQVEQLARQTVAANYDVLGADVDDLEVVATPRAMGKWAAHLQQYWNGYPVWQGKVRLVFHENGNLMLMGSDFHRNIDLDPRPALTPGAAADQARRDLPYQPELGDSYEVEPELMVLPVPVSESDLEYHLVYRVRVSTAEPLGEWVTHVDAHTGDVVWRYNDVHFDFGGDAEHEIQPHTYCNPDEFTAAPYLNLTVSGVGSTTTNAAGAWSVAGGGASATVTSTLQGPYVRVYNQNGTSAAFSGTAFAGVPFTLSWNDLNARQDERDVFDAVNRIHTFFQAFDPTFNYVNVPINAYVNRTDGYCPGNAWWNGTINFCAGTSTYGNTGEIQQVVEHEFGHGVQDAILGGTQGNEGLGEGNSDILGNLITQDHIIGLGFYLNNCTSGIRDALNTMQYPEDLNGSVHNDGQIIAGFNWDSMVLFQAAFGRDPGTVMSAERWHFGRVLMHPMYQDDQVFATFIADDDNGDLDDGTPNYDILAEAAENHSYLVPEILVGMFVYHDGAPYQTASVGNYQIKCTGASLGGGEVDAGSFELHYEIDGGAMTTVSMTASGDEFVGFIPSQIYGSVVRYYISAQNTLGMVGTSPREAPAVLHYFEVNDQFDDAMEIATAWVGGVPGDTAGSGTWERAVPQGTTYNGTPVQLGADHTPDPGVACWVTGAAAGSAAGSNDVDGGRTTLLSPLFDLTGGQNIQISYWRHYTNALGNSPNLDYWRADISNDGGATWTALENSTVSDTAWQQKTYALSTYFPVPGVVRLRFIAEDAGDGSLVEAQVDDFMLVGEFVDPTPVEGSPELQLVFGLDQNRPNPFNPTTQVKFSLDRAGAASLRVFDARGHLVKTLVNENLAAGAHTITWNGDDNGGRPVASGVYFYRLEANGQTAERRMLLVK
ncbi:MAG TPA: FlgD immunoglobulin-like domain containing protein [Candidatus Krumholzibacteria bacterium]|nr:FlgD immunoglobulin-like domain containing protein [Candidatus Krumholzibacteria bacterium]HPD72528.1 FlgD immunoglobulin-like domain containing protein [Candidatus Krumholzibacteria bacterium]HRY40540.1 FlgD immunoglobulin-like domain containing protein [Candidatus Krumholzibacteria bacterium]